MLHNPKPLDEQETSKQIAIACRQYQLKVGRLLISGEPDELEPRRQQLKDELVSELLGIVDQGASSLHTTERKSCLILNNQQ